jgi:hypothetical protein
VASCAQGCFNYYNVRDKTKDLLDAVLLNESTHEASLLVVRRAARRRRWNRHLRNTALMAVVLATGLTVFQQRRTGEKPAQLLSTCEAPYVVRSHPLPEGFVVRTQEKSVAVVTTIRRGVQFFSTVNIRPPERIDDETLLQLAPGAVLVRYQAGPAELVFPSNAVVGLESRAGPE